MENMNLIFTEKMPSLMCRLNLNHHVVMIKKYCIFKGFAHRAITICSEQYINDELAFLINVSIENGYKEDDLRKIMEEVTSKSIRQNTISKYSLRY